METKSTQHISPKHAREVTLDRIGLACNVLSILARPVFCKTEKCIFGNYYENQFLDGIAFHNGPPPTMDSKH